MLIVSKGCPNWNTQSIRNVNTQLVGSTFLCSCDYLTVGKQEAASNVMEEQDKRPYRLGTEFRRKDVVQGGEQQPVVLCVQAQEVAEGEDEHFLGVSVHPLLDLCEDSL